MARRLHHGRRRYKGIRHQAGSRLFERLEERTLLASFAVGDGSHSVTMGDVNGDGFLDIVTANFHGHDVSVLLGVGNGSFAAQRRFAVGQWPDSVTLADVNGDGILDLATAITRFPGYVSLQLGVGDGSFAAQQRITADNERAFPWSITMGDVNGDGVLDLVTANANYITPHVSVVLGLGDGTFAAPRQFSTGPMGGPEGSTPNSVVLGDVNGDGFLDIVTSNHYSDDVSVLLGVGDGTFGAPKRFAAGAWPYSVALGDIDGDGNLDLITANSPSSDVSVLLGVGDGTFAPQRRFATGSSRGSRSMTLGDVNGDGVLDIITSNNYSDDVSVLLGLGNGNFGEQRRFAVGDQPRSVTLGDVDGDGFLDIATANFLSNDISILFGVGNGTFIDTPVADETNVYIDDVTLPEDDDSGAFLDAFVPAGLLDRATGITFGPDGNFYVANFRTNEILRFDGVSGAFLDAFVPSGQGGLDGPALTGLIFGPDGNLYVPGRDTHSVLRYNGATGAFIDAFVSAGSGGLASPKGGVFGPDGHLYITSSATDEVLRYNGSTGAFINAFVTADAGGLDNPAGLTFGPDGNLYVGGQSTDSIFRYDGQTGDFIDIVVPSGSGGLDAPGGLLFGPNGRLYVVSRTSGQVLRYEGSTGAFLDVFANGGDDGFVQPIDLAIGPDENLYVSDDIEIHRYGTGLAEFTVSLSAPFRQEVNVDFATRDGTATAGPDYTTTSGTVTFKPGETKRTFVVPVLDDTLSEADESFFVNLTNPTGGAVITDGEAVGIIQRDDKLLLPVVTLALDSSEIAEAGGVATFTVTLSEVTTVPVTVDLEISGTGAVTDFITSSTQIVVSPGTTTGSLTVTAVDDREDEPDETVIVDITAINFGIELGVQQGTVTIVDDDEPPVPDVTLSVDNTTIAEAGGVAGFTVTLSEVTTVPVTVNLAFTGTAAAGDYIASAVQIVVAPGVTSGSITVTAVDDAEDEDDETVIVDIVSVTGGTKSGIQQQAVTIIDDDAPPQLTVTTLTASPSGFTAQFATELETSGLNLFDTQTLGMGPADVTLRGASNGPIAGSLVVGPARRQITFLKTSGPLEPDTYAVTLRSAVDGFIDVGGQLLDGDNDGTAGDNYMGTFTVSAPVANAIKIGIPDVVRGPGQPVNVPANVTTGIPLSISDGTNVRAIDLRVAYDPALLNITGATVGPGMPGGATVIVNTNTPGLAIVVFFSSTALPAGSSNFLHLQASVPAADSSGVYGKQQVLDVHAVTISDGNDNEFPVVADDAVHLASYFADVSGNGRINASDASQVARFAALIESGFAGSLNTDPLIVGDVSGNGRVNAADASLLAQFAALIDVPVIPPIPVGVLAAGAQSTRPAWGAGTPVTAIRSKENSASDGQDGGDDDSTFRVIEVFFSMVDSADGFGDSQIDAALADDAEINSSLEDAIWELAKSGTTRVSD